MLEATSPRIPCATFAACMGDPRWVKRFHAAGRPGVYARVLRTGAVEAGMEVIRHRFEGEPIPITEMMQDTRNPAPERMRWFLKTPIHEESRRNYEEKLGGG
jgi:MOSC domain-containing protein YiiM